jgi:hypothetical protein
VKKPKPIKLPCRFTRGEEVFVEGQGYATFIRQEFNRNGLWAWVRKPGRSQDSCELMAHVRKLDANDRPIDLPQGKVALITERA